MKIVRYRLFVFLLFYTSAGGWTQEWTDADPSNNLWSSPDNWLTGQVPILNDGWVGIDAGTPGPRVDSTLYDPQFETVGESWIRGVVIGDSGSGIGYMSMTSGTLKTGFPGDGSGGGAFGGVVIGYGDSTNPNCHGVLNMEGGLLISNWDFIVSGHGGGNGTVNMSGGEIHIHRLFVGWGGGTGTINLNNGLLLLPVEEGWGGDSRNGLLFLIYDTGKINITKGKIQLQGDRTKQVGEYIRTGKIEAYSGSGTVLVDFNKVNPGMTTVWACEGKPQTYCNPMDVKGADMQVTRFGDTYYYYATASQVYPNSTNGKGNPIFSSNNLMDWRFRGLTFDDDDDNIWGQYWFWGPEVYEKNGTYYLYSPCFRKINNADVGRICVSASSSPIGPFTEIKAPMFDWAVSEDVIDLGGFVDEDGSIYTYFTATEAGTGNVVYAARIAANMTDLATAPVKVIWPTQPWEKWITEGACVVKHEGIYYLAYSGDDFRQDYSIGYATSTNPLGPFTKYSGNPILTGSSEITKPGCPHFVWSPDHTELFVAYHSALQLPDRQFNLSRVHFEDSPGNPDIMVIENGSSKSPQPYPSGSRFTRTAVSDEFNGGTLDYDNWSTIWGQSKTDYDVYGGSLNLELADGCFWQHLADGQDLFLQRAPEGTWNITAKVTIDAQVNCEAAFLIVWQDHDNYMNLKTNYVNGKRFEVGVELAAVYNGTLVPNPIGNTVYLQVRKVNENTYQCYYSANGTNWTKIGVDVNLPFHEIKVGLGGYLVYSGRDNVIASFDFFRIERTSLHADFDHSKTVDINDFAVLSNCWGLNNPVIKPMGDLDEDAHVNLSDLYEFLKEWLLNCTFQEK